ncbi:MAG: hypothetical protein JNL10_04180 [Verrucomicrobiales bacterium]|nr:hypothetical protein [Verrucomicrobiales bacterium]
MKHFRLIAALSVVLTAGAAVPPPPQLFPQDSLLLLTVPDWTSAQGSVAGAPLGKLWADPAMKPFREKFESGFREKFLLGVEKDLGVKAQDFLALLQGQLSVAVIKAGWNPADEKTDPTVVLVMDTREKSDQLKARLAEVRQRLSEAKRASRLEKIRDVEFTTLTFERAADKSAKADPDDDDPKDEKDSSAPSKWELTFGQVDSALVLATSSQGLDRVVARLTGGTVPSLGETADFQTAASVGEFREATVYGYLQAASLVEAFESGGQEGSGEGGFGLQPKQLVSAMGLDGFRSVAASARQGETGLAIRFFAAVPEARRTGLFRLLRFEAKDAAPPAFVPADAAEFQRIRINGPQVWSGVESMLRQVAPQLNTVLMMSINALGKDRDPNFDFRKMFFGNLGDDWVSYEKAPRGKTLAELQNPPSVSLLGAVNPNEMLAAVRSLASLLPGGGDDLKEREVNGRKILTVKLPAGPGQPPRLLEIAAGSGYVAFASDSAILEEFLRSSESPVRSLRDLAGISEAAQQVGGMSTGVFGYQNQRESAAGLWEALRTGGSLDKVVPSMTSKQVEDAGSWLDFSALPPFEQVSKYLGMNVTSAAWDSTGFLLRSYTPLPK